MSTTLNPPTGLGAFAADTLRVELEDGVAVVVLDLPGEPVNKLNRRVIEDFTRFFDALERDASVRGVVIVSGKPDTFIAGADIEELIAFRSAEEASAASRLGHELLDRLERLRTPVVAAIHGACMGGGLETALACRYRIITDHPKTVLALPEVQLGLIPGAGGTQRLPRKVGLRTALDMILTGKTVRAKKALQLGLVEELVHPAILRQVAVDRARALAEGRTPSLAAHRKEGIAGRVLDDTKVGRSVVFRQAREQTLKKTHGNYPAPLAAIQAIQAGFDRGREAGFAEEARLFGEMAMTEVSKQLTFLFFATTALKKDPGVTEEVTPASVDKIGILGAGFMGAGIASVAVQQGTTVRLKDADLQRVGKGLAAIRNVVKERLTKKQITRVQFDDMMALANGTVDYSGFHNADIVIEAVFEDIAVKHQVLREVEPRMREDAIFASNTSTIPITRIAQAARRPERVVGMHFFSPVHKMPLLEVIRGERTAPEVIATAVAYGKKLGKTVIVVNDGPGFYTNRILAPYMNEAGRLLDEGARIEAVDRALVQFGFPVGPITLLDEVGIDVAGKVGNIISDAFGERMAPSQSLQKVLASGRYGRKSRKGFYVYDANGKKGGVDATIYDLVPGGQQRKEFAAEEIVQRCVLPMVNEAVRTLEEGIIRQPRDGDIGAVFGIGFPPFRGGPFRYVDTVGAATIVRQLQALEERFGARFTPAERLVEMARTGERFYPATGKPVE